MLSNVDILNAIKKGEIKIKPFNRKNLGSASIDLSLSDTWWVYKRKFIGKEIDLEKIGFKKVIRKIKSKEIKIKPKEIILALTKEKICLSNNILGVLGGRSRYARMGLGVHITSAIVQPGSKNHQVLEIYNFSPFTFILKEGMKISQIFFYRLENGSSKPYYKFGKIAKRQ